MEIFRAKIVDVSKSTLTIEASGSEDKVTALEDLLKPFGIREVVRTGVIAIERGNRIIKVTNNEESDSNGKDVL